VHAVSTCQVTDFTDFEALQFGGASNGVVTNRYGLRLSYTTEGITNAYGIYQSGTGIINYFNGSIGVGIASPSAPIHAIKTTEQLRLGYDTSNYASATVSSAGNLTLDTTGGTIFTPDTIENTTDGAGIVLKSPDGTRYRITVANGGTLTVEEA
jgi:hypothetical protein